MSGESQLSSSKVGISREVAVAPLFDLRVESVLHYPNHCHPESDNGHQIRPKQHSHPDAHLITMMTFVRFNTTIFIVKYLLGPRRVNLHV